MADLKIEESEGWEELTDIQEAIADGSLDIGRLWRSAAVGDWVAAEAALTEAGYGFDDGLRSVRVVSLPDDNLGDFYRVWVRDVGKKAPA